MKNKLIPWSLAITKCSELHSIDKLQKNIRRTDTFCLTQSNNKIKLGLFEWEPWYGRGRIPMFQLQIPFRRLILQINLL